MLIFQGVSHPILSLKLTTWPLKIDRKPKRNSECFRISHQFSNGFWCCSFLRRRISITKTEFCAAPKWLEESRPDPELQHRFGPPRLQHFVARSHLDGPEMKLGDVKNCPPGCGVLGQPTLWGHSLSGWWLVPCFSPTHLKNISYSSKWVPSSPRFGVNMNHIWVATTQLFFRFGDPSFWNIGLRYWERGQPWDETNKKVAFFDWKDSNIYLYTKQLARVQVNILTTFSLEPQEKSGFNLLSWICVSWMLEKVTQEYFP